MQNVNKTAPRTMNAICTVSNIAKCFCAIGKLLSNMKLVIKHFAFVTGSWKFSQVVNLSKFGKINFLFKKGCVKFQVESVVLVNTENHLASLKYHYLH